MKYTCPHCGQSFEQSSSKRKALATVVSNDTATMTTAQVYAHYKRAAHIEDVRFFSQHCNEPTIANQAIALLYDAEHGLSRAETLRRLTRLQESWRTINRQAPDEKRFWAALYHTNRHTRGTEYRAQRDRVLRHIKEACMFVRATYYRPTPTWCVSDTADGMIAQVGNETRDLVRAARVLYSTAVNGHPGEPTGHVYTFGAGYPPIIEVA